MSKLFIANWKANKTVEEAQEWLKEAQEDLEKTGVSVVVCAPFTVLPVLAWALQNSTLKLGAQTVSSFPSGAYTGEVSAQMLGKLVTHCIVGHSERKKYFGETETSVVDKIENLLEKGITPVLCAADLDELEIYLNIRSTIKDNIAKIIFVYEPPSAISGGGDFHPETPEAVAAVIAGFKKVLGDTTPVLYGGSVNREVIADFLARKEISGFLIGKASLDPAEFLNLVNQAA